MPQALTAQASCLNDVPVDRNLPGDVTTDPLAGKPDAMASWRATATPGAFPPPTEDQLAQVACTAVRTVLAQAPGMRFYPHDFVGGPAFQASLDEAEGNWAVGSRGRTPGGLISVEVTRQPKAFDPADDQPWGVGEEHSLQDLGGGRHLATWTEQLPFPQTTALISTVVLWTGRTRVMVSASNVDTVRPAITVSAAVPLTVEQLTAIVQDPGFAVFG
ncbi:hypothetical protein F4553_000492 [Allocatelliglobosispora scoriae]|uniref:Uncharacterized protein n=1 Tax=Allocatelliglobosispora scoriae TaxID=643052 RepID=A0A841BJ93_9ACTN|nr:hypothetical protein [Allocatelliglobosispora scoriae]MBB5867113.1 hypothetical protein [Allocatelliglobosispora scoriae]